MSLTPADSATYWLRWQVFVCGALIALPAAAAAALLPRLRRAAPPPRAADLWVSCWARLHPGWLLGFRAFAFVAAVALLARVLVAHGVAAFYFYTQWTFLLVTIYFAFATAISAHGCWVYLRKNSRKADESHGFLNVDVENHDISNSISGERMKDATNKMVSYYEQIANERRAGFWGRCMQAIYQTSAGATMLTDVTYWGLLVPVFYRDKFGLALFTDGMHSLNVIFLLTDTVLNNMSFPWYRMAFFVFWSCTYVTFQWVLHACGALSCAQETNCELIPSDKVSPAHECSRSRDRHRSPPPFPPPGSPPPPRPPAPGHASPPAARPRLSLGGRASPHPRRQPRGAPAGLTSAAG